MVNVNVLFYIYGLGGGPLIKSHNIKNFTLDRTENAAAELTVVLSNKDGKFNRYFYPTDTCLLYYGLGSLPSAPQFYGTPINVSGTTEITVTLQDYLVMFKNEIKKIDEYSNYDGFEVGQAMKDLCGGLNMGRMLSPVAYAGGGTNPLKSVTSDFRFPTYTTKFEILSALNDLATDDSCSSGNTYNPLPYIFYMRSGGLYHKKSPDVNTAYPVLTLDYADDLITVEPEYQDTYLCTGCTYVGANYKDSNGIETHYEGTYTDDSRELAYSFMIKRVVKEDNNLTSNVECYEKARQYVTQNRHLVVNTTITFNNYEGYDLIPGLSVIQINNSRYGISGKHLVKRVTTNWAQGKISTSLELSQRKSVLTDFL